MSTGADSAMYTGAATVEIPMATPRKKRVMSSHTMSVATA